ncbi:MAG TPA: VOC family protein [Bryobacteraceae bacterium]|nr:VOC family protein [Bryobacteraceae bacterium]
MVRSLVLALVALPMFAAELKVDHVTVAGRDLSALRKALDGAGIRNEYGGPHANHATEMALTSFPDGSYLELIAIRPHADPAAVAANQWHGCLESNGGPCGWATRPADIEGEAARLRAAGLAVTPLMKSGRKRPDGVQLEWETAQVGSGNGNFFPFLIHDFTPRERRAYPSGKPTVTQFRGITKVVLGVKDLNASIRQYQTAFGLSAPRIQDDPRFAAKLAWFEGTPVVLATPDSPRSWLAERLGRFGEIPCAFILGATRGVLGSGEIAQWFGKAVFWISPQELGWRLGVE